MVAAASSSLSIIIYVISAISLLSNVVLLILYFRCPLKKIKSYKYFFLLTIIEDAIFSATFSVLIPLVVSGSDYIIFYGTGMLCNRTIASILLIVFSASFFTSLLLVTNSFLYRYLQLCRLEFFEKFSTEQTVIVGGLINLLIVLNISAAMYIVFWPDAVFVQVVMSTLSITRLDANCAPFIGFSLKYNMNAIDLLLLVNLVTIVVSMMVINIFCAKRIISFLRRATQRSSFLSYQRQMFILLLLQSACPLVFLQVPWLFSVLLLFTGFSTNAFITSIISISIAMYPISSPVVIIAFMKEYRNAVLVRLRLKKPLEQTSKNLFHKNIVAVTGSSSYSGVT